MLSVFVVARVFVFSTIFVSERCLRIVLMVAFAPFQFKKCVSNLVCCQPLGYNIYIYMCLHNHPSYKLITPARFFLLGILWPYVAVYSYNMEAQHQARTL